jgi:ribosomal protein S27AE
MDKASDTASHVVCGKCGFAGKPAFDGQCSDCGGDLAGSPGAGSSTKKAVKKDDGKKGGRSSTLNDYHGEGLMNCRNDECGATLSEEEQFCTECGTSRDEEQVSVAECSFCSLELPVNEGISNCPRCGTRTVVEAEQVFEAASKDDDGDDDDDDKGDQDKDGRDDGDDKKKGSKETKCPACGASVNTESKKNESAAHCIECGYTLQERDRYEEQAEHAVSALVVSEDPDTLARRFANEIIWG